MQRPLSLMFIAVAAVLGATALYACNDKTAEIDRLEQAGEEAVAQARESAGPPAASVQQQAAKKKATPAVLDERHRYEAFAAAKIRDFGKRIGETKVGSSRVSGRNKGRVELRLREMERLYGDIRSSYQDMIGANAEEWKAARAAVDASIVQFESAY